MSQEKVIEFTFTSGVKVKIKKISPYLLTELQKKYPEPQPPMKTVEILGEKTQEPNYNDPDYIEELQKYNQDQEERVRSFLMRKGVIYELSDDDKKALADLRTEYKKDFDIDLPEEDDKVAFLTYLAVADATDITNLIEKIVGRIQPTESQVREAQNSFPRPVRR